MESSSNQIKIYFRLCKVSNHCLDGSIAHTSDSLEGVPTYAEHLLAAFLTPNHQLMTAVSLQARHKESLEHDETRKSRPAKPSPNLDNAGPSMLRPMGLLVTASCDIAWDRNRGCSGVSVCYYSRLPNHLNTHQNDFV